MIRWLWLWVVLLVGCESQQPPPGQALKVKPAELFVGDLKRLEAHLNLTHGCVELEMPPPHRDIWISHELEIWENGQLQEQKSAASEGRTRQPTLMSVALKKEEQFLAKPRLTISFGYMAEAGSGSKFMQMSYPWRPNPKVKGFKVPVVSSETCKLPEDIELKAGVYHRVWAYVEADYDAAGPGFVPVIGPGRSPGEAAKVADRALVLRISWKEVDD